MKTYNKQKVVTVRKLPNNKEYPYYMGNRDAASKAMLNLSANSFLVYFCINMNQDGFTFALSKKDIMQKTGMSENTYLKAVNELIEKRYLVQESEDSNNYTFFENPESPYFTEVGGRSKEADEKQAAKYKPTHEDKEQLKYYLGQILNGELTLERLIEILPDCGYSEECVNWYHAELRKAIA